MRMMSKVNDYIIISVNADALQIKYRIILILGNFQFFLTKPCVSRQVVEKAVNNLKDI